MTAHSLTLELYGARLVLSADDAAGLSLLRTAFPAFAQTAVAQQHDPRFWLSRDAAQRYVLERESGSGDDGRERIADGVNAAGVVDALEYELRMHVAYHSPTHVLVHAGAVAVGARAIIVPGGSFSGKTALVAALISAGASYYSDEYAVLDSEGFLHPFPTPLAMRTPGAGIAQNPVSAIDLGARNGHDRARIALVVLTQYRPDAHWQPVQLTPATAILKLFEHAYQGRDRPELTLQTLHAALADAVTLSSDRGDAAATATAILGWLGQVDGTPG